MAEPPERKMLNVADSHFSQRGGDPRVRGNNVVHCVADPQVMEKLTSALKVIWVLAVLKVTVNRIVNSNCSQNFGSSESYVVNSDS